MEQLNKYYFILLSILLFGKATAQDDKKFFITKDTLFLENPVVISFKDSDGMFLTNENYIKSNKKINIQKMIDEGKAFILSDEFYKFLSLKELEMKLIYNDCSYTSSYELSNKIIVRKLDNSVKNFLICFVRLDFYHKKVLTQNHKKTNFPKKRNLDFYKIVFPICK